MRKAPLGLVMTGKAGSETQVIWRMPWVVFGPSVTVRVTPKPPSESGVPEIIPVTGSASNPGGRPLASKRAAEVAFSVNTRKLNGCPVRAVTLVPLTITGPEEGAGWIVIVNVADPVPVEFVALTCKSTMPGTVGTPPIIPVMSLKLRFAGIGVAP